MTASGEMRCTACRDEIVQFSDGVYRTMKGSAQCPKNNRFAHTPPESAIEPEPQATCPICGKLMKKDYGENGQDILVHLSGEDAVLCEPAASSAIEVAPQEAYCHECETHLKDGAGHESYCSQVSEVAPKCGKYSDPTELAWSCNLPKGHCGDCSSMTLEELDECASPEQKTIAPEVAPSREQKLEDALRECRKIFERQGRAICGNDKLSGCEEFYRGYNAVVQQENAAGWKGMRIIDDALEGK